VPEAPIPPLSPAGRRTRVLEQLRWAFPAQEARPREILTRFPGDDPEADALDLAERTARPRREQPPLLFVHGAFHGAWCWDVHWMPQAAAQGWDCYAVSLRGHGGSGGHDGLRRWQLRDYEHDVMQAIVSLPQPPVLVGHSMGGLVVQRVLERYPAPAAALVAPVAFDHGLRLAASIARHHPGDLLRVLAGQSLPMRPDYLFPRLGAAQAQAYIGRLQPESPLVQYEITLPRRKRSTRSPVAALGGGDDRLVSPVDVVRTAAHYGTTARMFTRMGHDLMLDAGWRTPLTAMLAWLRRTVPAPDAEPVG
jgi:pimeloyl-ACP methyl ester carboxylesterase